MSTYKDIQSRKTELMRHSPDFPGLNDDALAKAVSEEIDKLKARIDELELDKK